MKRRTIAALATAVVLAGAALLAGCSDDPQNRPVRSGPVAGDSFENLTEIWHPLNNLEEACSQRNIDRYREALDADYYTFFFSPADFASGQTAQFWTYDEDTEAAERMFDPQLPDIGKRAVNLEFDLIFDKDSIVWSEFVPADPPNETWYSTTVGYTFYIKLGDGVREYVQRPGSGASITVRQHPGEGKWRIVQITDIPGTAQNSISIRQLAERDVQDASLGEIKAIYTPPEPTRKAR
jgi:hypothetical protein